ncbi:hypothetical protein KTS45_17810 [Halomicroarcula limicola]|uniref:Uncharacterized protein n=1 Tax=Haloarcula limicola TaxID=1429915 RepID=A0A8J7YD45_9EURY|nr:hypothetical protein [Halomicroarcula limicola]MBV0926064.1 hypothetical protein [Halomicroarcula limicola]
MSDSTGDEQLDRIEQGLDALFATEVAKEVLEAVDFEAILAEEPAEDPVDIDRLAQAIGRPVGRILAARVIGGSGAAGLAKQTLGSEVGSRVAAKTFRVAVENVDTQQVTETLVELDEETLPGPTLQEMIGPAIEDSDVFAFDHEDLPEDVDAGPDASGVHDAGGADHTGPLDGTDGGDGTPEE